MNLLTGVAIGLAATAACCFATAAVLQHRAIRTSTGDGPLSPAALGRTLRTRGWLGGLALTTAGTALHATALVLAPLSVVQPIGVLAVPIAVLAGALRTRARPTSGVLVGVALCLAGVATFVVTEAGHVLGAATLDGTMLAAGVAVAAVVAALGAVGMRRSGWVRCTTCATAGAIALGLVSTLMRALSQAVAGGLALLSPVAVTTAAGMAAAAVVGGWLVQQAFAAGAPDVVVACCTVVDPLVAVLLGAVLLGEGVGTAPGTWVLLGSAAVIATAGVVTLASRHPEALARAADQVPVP